MWIHLIVSAREQRKLLLPFTMTLTRTYIIIIYYVERLERAHNLVQLGNNILYASRILRSIIQSR